MGLTALTSPVGVELTDFSPSRLSTAGQCGRKFEFAYVNRLPQPYDKGALLLGDAVHNGVEHWYGPPEDGDAFKERSLPAVISAQWKALLPPAVWEQVQHLRDLDEECANVAAAILFKRPDLKSVRTTKEFLTSDAGKEYAEARDKMLTFCDLLPDVKWPKDEDPYKAYCKAAEWGTNMERRWRHLPRPLLVEGSFVLELFGFRVRGRIDALRADPMPPTGEAFLTIVDYKTGRQPLTQMEAFLQSFIYYSAVEASPDLPTTDRVAFYQARKEPTPWQQGRIDPARHAALASRIFNDRARKIAMAQFAPEPGFWCKSCDFNDLCQREISLWDGENGLIAELMA